MDVENVRDGLRGEGLKTVEAWRESLKKVKAARRAFWVAVEQTPKTAL
jgi:hypothetical protein